MAFDDAETEHDLIGMTTQIATAYMSRNQVMPADIPTLLQNVHSALSALASGTAAKAPQNTVPAVSIKKSVTDGYLICLEDGKKLTMLKRYLAGKYGLTPDQYRTKWGLPPDYPMVAPEYAKRRSDFAKKFGLGRKPGQKRGRKAAS